jgi:serine/threonine-protein kinase RsbW
MPPPVSEAVPVELRLAPGPLARPVGTRVVTALAARADLPLDRVVDALLLTDTLLGGVLPAPGQSVLDLVFEPSPGRLGIALAGLPAGTADRLLRIGPAVEGVPVLTRLSDEAHVTVGADGTERLDLVVLAARVEAR